MQATGHVVGQPRSDILATGHDDINLCYVEHNKVVYDKHEFLCCLFYEPMCIRKKDMRDPTEI